MIKITCEVPTQQDKYEAPVRVDAHWNDPNLVVLTIGDEQRTVSASDLAAAIKNATNSNRHG